MTAFRRNPAPAGQLHVKFRQIFWAAALNLVPAYAYETKCGRAFGSTSAGSGEQQVHEGKQRGANAGGDQGVIGPEVAVEVTLNVALDFKPSWMVFLGHCLALGDGNKARCEVVHIGADFFAAA